MQDTAKIKEIIAKTIDSNESTINLAHCHIEDEDAKAIENEERKRQKIKIAIQQAEQSKIFRNSKIHIKGSESIIADEDAKAIAELLKSNQHAPEVELDLGYSKISSKALQTIIKSIRGSSLSNLTLDLSMIFEQGLDVHRRYGNPEFFSSEFFLSDGIYPTTFSLNLCNNKIGVLELKTLSALIETSRKCPSHFTLDLGCISDIANFSRCHDGIYEEIHDAFIALFQLLVKHTRQLNLKINFKYFQPKTIQKIEEIIQSEQCRTILNTNLLDSHKDSKSFSKTHLKTLIEQKNKEIRKQNHANNIANYAMFFRANTCLQSELSVKLTEDIIKNHIGPRVVGNTVKNPFNTIHDNIHKILEQKNDAEKINAQREREKPKPRLQNNQQNNDTNEDKNESPRKIF